MNKNQIMCTDATKMLHFVGIGGVSMSSLAMYYKEKGCRVTGSDMCESDVTRRLEKCGICVHISHREENVYGADAVIYTGAVKDDNPEIKYSREHGIKLYTRSEALGEIMRGYKTRIGVAGMHGKSTATCLISHIFIGSGKEPTVFSGASTREMNGACRFGKYDYFILEACEYRDSFLDFNPDIAVILNIDRDHTDYFTDSESIFKSFEKYGLSKDVKTLIYNMDDLKTADIGRRCENGISFGIETESDYRAVNIRSENGYSHFDIYRKEEKYINVRLGIPGRHNIYNALAAVAVCDICGIDKEDIKKYSENFEGLDRRFEYKGRSFKGTPIYADYAHHPTEIKATVACAKEICKGKVCCVFEPHTYSRTRDLFSSFVSALSCADTVICTDIFAAREKDEFGVSSQMLIDELNKHTESMYAKNYSDAAQKAVGKTEKDDIILILGAGNVYKSAEIAVKFEHNE